MLQVAIMTRPSRQFVCCQMGLCAAYNDTELLCFSKTEKTACKDLFEQFNRTFPDEYQ